MERKRLQYLLDQYLADKATTAELRELSEYDLKSEEGISLLSEILAEGMAENQEDTELVGNRFTDLAQKVLRIDKLTSPSEVPESTDYSLPSMSSNPLVHPRHLLKTAWFRYAAILVLVAGTVTFLYKYNQPAQEITQEKSNSSTDILPGGNKATLTLADGRIFELDNSGNGSLAKQGNMEIIKLDSGSLAYTPNIGSLQPGPQNENGKELYNIISTPRGGQYRIFLPDGTELWLNAASSVRFPTSFAGSRKVKITGEVYFKVSKNKADPFIVDVDGRSTIEVLGTSFNVNAYNDEPAIKTTLLDGSIRVHAPLIDKPVILTPGQQACIENNQLSVVNHRTEAAIAWKNGLFNFDGSSLREFLRQLARWYDLDIVYPQQMPVLTFEGTMGRDLALDDALEILSQFKIKYKIEGRKLTIQ